MRQESWREELAESCSPVRIRLSWAEAVEDGAAAAEPGRRSSRPAPSRRSRPWSAVLAEVKEGVPWPPARPPTPTREDRRETALGFLRNEFYWAKAHVHGRILLGPCTWLRDEALEVGRTERLHVEYGTLFFFLSSRDNGVDDTPSLHNWKILSVTRGIDPPGRQGLNRPRFSMGSTQLSLFLIFLEKEGHLRFQ
jgi:hypothetical protein